MTRFAPGDEVFGYAEGRFGAHAEYVAVSATSLIAPVPDGVDLKTAAAATEGGRTPCRASARGDRAGAAGARPRRDRRDQVGGGPAARRPRCARRRHRAHRARRAGARARGRARRRPPGPGLHPDRRAGGCRPRHGREELRGVPADPEARRRLRVLGPRAVRPEHRPPARHPTRAGAASPGGLPVPDGDARGARAPQVHLESRAFRPVLDRTYRSRTSSTYRYVESRRKVGSVLISVRGD